MKTKFYICNHCDPYHARFHHHGERVIKYDGATPIQWVVGDEYYGSFDEAKSALMKLALILMDENDDLSWEDESDIEYMKQTMNEDGIEFSDADFEWYQGRGVYFNNGGRKSPLLLEDGAAFSYDSETFTIEEDE